MENNISLASFYNHASLMRDVEEFNDRYRKEEAVRQRTAKEKQLFSVNDIVITSGTGTYKAGIEGIILDCWYESIYPKYLVQFGKFKHVERQKDLVKKV